MNPKEQDAVQRIKDGLDNAEFNSTYIYSGHCIEVADLRTLLACLEKAGGETSQSQPGGEVSSGEEIFAGLVSVPAALMEQARSDATRVRELEFELKAARIELEITNGQLEKAEGERDEALTRAQRVGNLIVCQKDLLDLMDAEEAAEARASKAEAALAGREGKGSSSASRARTGPVARPETDAEPSVPDRVIIGPDDLQEFIRCAYIAGCNDVHANWQPDDEPDFKEASYDYVASLDFAASTKPFRGMPQFVWSDIEAADMDYHLAVFALNTREQAEAFRDAVTKAVRP